MLEEGYRFTPVSEDESMLQMPPPAEAVKQGGSASCLRQTFPPSAGKRLKVS